MRHFKTREAALAYVMPELLDSLLEDLERQCGSEREHYTDEDRNDMEKRIADLEEIEQDVMLANAEADMASLIAKGATLQDFIRALNAAETLDLRSVALIQKARDELHREGEIEIDDETIIAKGDDPGAYVLACAWVGASEADEVEEHDHAGA